MDADREQRALADTFRADVRALLDAQLDMGDALSDDGFRPLASDVEARMRAAWGRLSRAPELSNLLEKDDRLSFARVDSTVRGCLELLRQAGGMSDGRFLRWLDRAKFDEDTGELFGALHTAARRL